MDGLFLNFRLGLGPGGGWAPVELLAATMVVTNSQYNFPFRITWVIWLDTKPPVLNLWWNTSAEGNTHAEKYFNVILAQHMLGQDLEFVPLPYTENASGEGALFSEDGIACFSRYYGFSVVWLLQLHAPYSPSWVYRKIVFRHCSEVVVCEPGQHGDEILLSSISLCSIVQLSRNHPCTGAANQQECMAF